MLGVPVVAGPGGGRPVAVRRSRSWPTGRSCPWRRAPPGDLDAGARLRRTSAFLVGERAGPGDQRRPRRPRGDPGGRRAMGRTGGGGIPRSPSAARPGGGLAAGSSAGRGHDRRRRQGRTRHVTTGHADPTCRTRFDSAPRAAWVFVLLAVARFAWALREASFGAVVDPWQVGQVVLFGDAVGRVHPAAGRPARPASRRARRGRARSSSGWSCSPRSKACDVLVTPLQPIFEGLTPGDDAASSSSRRRWSTRWRSTCWARSRSPRSRSGSPGRAATRTVRARGRCSAVVAALVVLIAVTGIVAVSRLPYEELPMTPHDRRLHRLDRGAQRAVGDRVRLPDGDVDRGRSRR